MENWDKLHGRRLAKLWLDTNLQPFRISFDHASKASKVRVLVRISPTWGPSKLRRRGQTMSEEAENCCPVTIWPNVDRGVCPSFPKKNLGWPSNYAFTKMWFFGLQKPSMAIRVYRWGMFQIDSKNTLNSFFDQMRLGRVLIHWFSYE